MRERLEKMLRSGSASDVITEAKNQFAQNPNPSADLLWYAVYAIRAAGSTGDWTQVIQLADKVLTFKVDDLEAKGWIQLCVGNACLYRGDAYRAEVALAEFHRIAKKTPSLQRLVPFGLHSLAMLMRFLQRSDEETRRFRQAARGFQKLGMNRQYLLCRLSIVWSNLLRGLPAPGLAELSDLSSDLAACTDEEVLMNADLARALYESLTGDTLGSDSICKRLLKQETVPTSLAADATWLLGCNARARGDYSLSQQYAAAAHELAAKDYWPLQMTRIEELKRAAAAN